VPLRPPRGEETLDLGHRSQRTGSQALIVEPLADVRRQAHQGTDRASGVSLINQEPPESAGMLSKRAGHRGGRPDPAAQSI